MTTSPVKGMHLVVNDIEAAVSELEERGIETGPIVHMNPEGAFEGVDQSGPITGRTRVSPTLMAMHGCFRRWASRAEANQGPWSHTPCEAGIFSLPQEVIDRCIA